MTRRRWHEIHNVSVLPEYPRDYIFGILQKVEPVSNLNGVGCGSSCSFGVFTAMIPAAQHFNPWILLEPPNERIRAPIRKNIHQPSAFSRSTRTVS